MDTDSCFNRVVRYALCAVVAASCCSCAPDTAPKGAEQESGSVSPTVNTDSLLYAAVRALPEVRKRAAYIDSVTKGERTLLVWTSEEPTASQPFYHIDVGEDNGTSFVAHFHFLVTPDTPPLIRVYDPASETILTLEEWRTGNTE